MPKRKEKKPKYSYKPNEKTFYDTIIIGGGVVGWGTAMYGGRLGLKTLIIGDIFGGTIILTHLVENYPGFIRLTGPELGEKMETHARDYDIDILSDKVTKVEGHKAQKGSCFRVTTADGKKFLAKAVIFCTGTKVKKLNVPGEKEFENKGAHYCALCDGPLYKGRERIGVVGGSDSAVKEGLLLTEYAKKVYIIYRGEKVHPEPINMTRAEGKIKQGKLEIINNTNVKEIKGNTMMTQIIFDKPYKGKKEFKLDALFIDIGHIPLSELAKEIRVKLNEKNEIVIDRKSRTNIPGIFAAGDVVDTEFKQAITGVGEGVAAVYQAYKYVNENEFICPVSDDEFEMGRKKFESENGFVETKAIVERVKKAAKKR